MPNLTDAAARRELDGHIVVARQSWQFAQTWAASLTVAQLRQAAKLHIPGDAGMAAEQELRRRSSTPQGG